MLVPDKPVVSHTAPLGHTLGWLVPTSGVMNPIGAGRHEDCVVRGWNVPTGHSVKFAAPPEPPPQNAPLGHGSGSPSGQ